MSTKLYIPYNVVCNKGSQFLLVYSNQKRKVLACSLSARLLLKGLSDKEYLILLRLAETMENRAKGQIYYLLALRGMIPQKDKGLIKFLSKEFLFHQEWEKIGISLKGDPKSQLSRLEQQLQLSLKVVNEKKVKPSQLRWMGIGYRDKGNLSTYTFNWRDLSGKIQDDHSQLFARDDESIIKTAILKARNDLKIFSVGQSDLNGENVPEENSKRRNSKQKNFLTMEEEYFLKVLSEIKQENMTKKIVEKSKSIQDIELLFRVLFPDSFKKPMLESEKLSPQTTKKILELLEEKEKSNLYTV